MTDYSKTKIYKIESHIGDKVYVGSTCKQYLSQRFQQHKNDYKHWKETKHKKITSFDLFDEYGPENCRIILIEEYPCISKDAKNAREGHFIRELNCVNKVIIGRTKKEYYEDNKDKSKKYYEDNKDKIKEYNQEYRELNKDDIKDSKKEYYELNIKKIKEYNEVNKEKIKQYNKQYREKQKQLKLQQQEENDNNELIV